MIDLTPQILYQDENLLVINKPAGLLVHAAAHITHYSMPTGRQALPVTQPTLVDWLLVNFPEVRNVGDDPQTRPGIVHRLDKDTSGVMIIARNQTTFDYLKKLFSARGGPPPDARLPDGQGRAGASGGQPQIKKTYLALVHGQVKEKSGIIDKPLGIKSGTVKRTTHTADAKDIRLAVTEYHRRQLFDKYTLLEVYPRTGRTHQIRVHLASIGYPIVGDQLYGRKNDKQLLGRQFLHAESVEFTNLDGSRLKIAADLPSGLSLFLESLTPLA